MNINTTNQYNYVEILADVEDNENKAIAVLIKNTRTTKRHISLIEMAK